MVEAMGRQLGITCLLVSHDAADTLSWADRIMVLRRGQVVQEGSPEQVYKQPVDEYTAGLFGDYNLISGADKLLLAPHAHGAGPFLVRPEQFRLGPATSALMGHVRAIRFFGSFYEVEVQLSANVVRVWAGSVATSVGEAVGISVVAGGGWQLSS
ncbi:TOBE domain-containing protein [Hymenobacter sp. BRD67]|uniref:TOBE domain-containing protein n=1 Tax=Hymenobacter sp. BRD67 TaxID=2675877 RepID=UPI0020B6EB56